MTSSDHHGPSAMFGVSALAALAAMTAMGCAAPTFTIASPRDCTASETARTVSSVTDQLADYLDAHPEVDKTLTEARNAPETQRRIQVQTYLLANPSVMIELRAIREPLQDLRSRCNVALPGLE